MARQTATLGVQGFVSEHPHSDVSSSKANSFRGPLPPSTLLVGGVAILLLMLDRLHTVAAYLQEDLGVVQDSVEVFAHQDQGGTAPKTELRNTKHAFCGFFLF